MCDIMELTYMELLEVGLQINLPNCMLKHMHHVFTTLKRSLVFGSLITTIMEHFKVPLNPYMAEELTGKNFLGEDSVKRLGVVIQDRYLV